MPTQIGVDVLGGRLSGNLHHCWQVAPTVRWHRVTVSTKNKDHAGDKEFRGCSPFIWNSLPAALPTATLSPLTIARQLKATCSADRQCVWGPFMTCSANLLIIIIIILLPHANVTIRKGFGARKDIQPNKIALCRIRIQQFTGTFGLSHQDACHHHHHHQHYFKVNMG